MQIRRLPSCRTLAAAFVACSAPLLASACAGAAEPTFPATGASSRTAGSASSPTGLPGDRGVAVSAAAEPSAPAAAPDERSACPTNMVLIDGDYCTELELKCLRSTYAPQNKKVICHEFESPSKCTGDKVKKRYCIDKYEYPNAKSERPLVNKNFPEAQRLCAAQGKRMCTESEWTMACEGPTYKPYPYGYRRDPSKCRGDRPYRFPNVKKTFSKNKDEAHAELERLWDGVVSGSQPGCVSDYGVYDMPGNADELASSETHGPRSEFDNVTTGGPWLDGVRNQCRPKIYTHNEGFAYYYLSFRCCAEADGKPTDPRAPKQIKRGEKWKG